MAVHAICDARISIGAHWLSISTNVGRQCLTSLCGLIGSVYIRMRTIHRHDSPNGGVNECCRGGANDALVWVMVMRFASYLLRSAATVTVRGSLSIYREVSTCLILWVGTWEQVHTDHGGR